MEITNDAMLKAIGLALAGEWDAAHRSLVPVGAKCPGADRKLIEYHRALSLQNT
jgi:hypothetical protein